MLITKGLLMHMTILRYCRLYRVYSLPCFPTDVPPPTDGSVSVVALNETGKVRVTWSRPTLGPGQEITGYSVQYRRRGTTHYTTRLVCGSSTTSYTITNLNVWRCSVWSESCISWPTWSEWLLLWEWEASCNLHQWVLIIHIHIRVNDKSIRNRFNNVLKCLQTIIKYWQFEMTIISMPIYV